MDIYGAIISLPIHRIRRKNNNPIDTTAPFYKQNGEMPVLKESTCCGQNKATILILMVHIAKHIKCKEIILKYNHLTYSYLIYTKINATEIIIFYQTAAYKMHFAH